jgi:hypothetical protein
MYVRTWINEPQTALAPRINRVHIAPTLTGAAGSNVYVAFSNDGDTVSEVHFTVEEAQEFINYFQEALKKVDTKPRIKYSF